MSDPTLQSSGRFRTYAVNRTDLPVASPQLNAVEGVPEQRPPGVTWSPGKDYQVLASHYSGVPRFPGNGGAATALMEVEDMSLPGVDDGQGFRLYSELSEWSIRLYATVLKTAQGTVVQPAIGLFNLVDHPGAWSLVGPKVFTGEWGIQLMSALLVSSLDLSLQYLPSQPDLRPAPTSRLVLFMDGASSALVSPGRPVDDAPGPGPGGPLRLFGATAGLTITRL